MVQWVFHHEDSDITSFYQHREVLFGPTGPYGTAALDRRSGCSAGGQSCCRVAVNQHWIFRDSLNQPQQDWVFTAVGVDSSFLPEHQRRQPSEHRVHSPCQQHSSRRCFLFLNTGTTHNCHRPKLSSGESKVNPEIKPAVISAWYPGEVRRRLLLSNTRLSMRTWTHRTHSNPPERQVLVLGPSSSTQNCMFNPGPH